MRHVVLRESAEGWFVVGEVASQLRPDWTDDIDQEIRRAPHWCNPAQYGLDMVGSLDPQDVAEGWQILPMHEALMRYPAAIAAWRAGDDSIHDRHHLGELEEMVLDDLRGLAERGDLAAVTLIESDASAREAARYLTLDTEISVRDRR